MASLNKAILIGNLGRDAELTYTGGGKAKMSFTLATNENFKNREGEWQKETSWHRIVAWGEMAEGKSDLLKKGKQVFVEGRIRTRKYTTKDGDERTITEVTASRLFLLGKAPAGEGDALAGTAPSEDDAQADGAEPF